MSKKKILLVAPYSSRGTGGIGTWSKILIDYSEGREDVLLLFLNTVQGFHKRSSMNNRFSYLLIGILDSFFILFRLFWNMFRKRPDVVHYTSSAANALYKDRVAIWIVKALFRKSFVIHWHFGRIPTIFQEKGKEYRLLLKVCKKADISIVIDEKSYQTLLAANINTEYVPNPIPYQLQMQSVQLNGDSMDYCREEGTVLYVGHMLQTKGIFEIVEACADCDAVKQLIMVGPFFDSGLKAKLEDEAHNRRKGSWLKLVGEIKREDVWDCYKNCSLFCLPSYSEGFPNVILEAMAFGCPIVATNVGAIPEMLENECGVIVEPKKVEPLREALNYVLSNKINARTMGIKAREKVLTNYTIDRVYSKYNCIWNKYSINY